MTTSGSTSLPDLTGRTAIVTGANSGIGRAAASAMAGAGARVVLGVRSIEKGRAAAEAMPGETEVRQLDLASLASVRDFASGWDGEIDLLINNAGVMVPPLSRTAEGFELQFGTNHLGHFALTNLLLDRVTGRVVTVSSTGHRMGRIDFEERLRAVAAAYVRFATEDAALLELMFAGKQHEQAGVLHDAADRAFAVMLELIAQGQEQGALEGGDPERVGLVLFATIQGIAALVTGGIVAAEQIDELVADATERFLRGSHPVGVA